MRYSGWAEMVVNFIEGGDTMVLEVKVRNNNVEKGIRRQLKKKVMKDGFIKELKRRQFYEKLTSLKRQRKLKESIKRLNKLRRLRAT